MRSFHLIILLLTVTLAGLQTGCAGDHYLYIPNESARITGFKAGAEPAGFGGIRWGTELSALNGLEYLRTDPSYGGIDFYVRKGDTLTMGKVKLRTIQYGFLKGKFYAGITMTQGLSNCNSLRDNLFESYGPGAKPFKNLEEYLWIGKNAIMSLRYDDKTGTAHFYVRSDALKERVIQEATYR
jgi:hypothetical protein